MCVYLGILICWYENVNLSVVLEFDLRILSLKGERRIPHKITDRDRQVGCQHAGKQDMKAKGGHVLVRESPVWLSLWLYFYT